MKFEVSFDNKNFGIDSKIMTLEEISRYSLSAYCLALDCVHDFRTRSNGRWTVRRVGDKDNA